MPVQDTANVKLGVCKVEYDGNDLGYTKGGVEVTVETETYEATVDQFGNTPIAEKITGRMVEATVPLAETTLENLVAIMPGSNLVTDGTDATIQKVDVTTSVGTNLLDEAKKLVLRPIENTTDYNTSLASDDSSDDFVIPKAATPGSLTFAYRLDEERIYNCTFKGYPDPSTKILFTVGDESATA